MVSYVKSTASNTTRPHVWFDLVVMPEEWGPQQCPDKYLTVSDTWLKFIHPRHTWNLGPTGLAVFYLECTTVHLWDTSRPFCRLRKASGFWLLGVPRRFENVSIISVVVLFFLFHFLRETKNNMYCQT